MADEEAGALGMPLPLPLLLLLLLLPMLPGASRSG